MNKSYSLINTSISSFYKNTNKRVTHNNDIMEAYKKVSSKYNHQAKSFLNQYSNESFLNKTNYSNKSNAESLNKQLQLSSKSKAQTRNQTNQSLTTNKSSVISTLREKNNQIKKNHHYLSEVIYLVLTLEAEHLYK